MKALPFNIPKPANTAIIYQIDSGRLYNELHQHEEVQISWIIKGEGTLLAGDTVHSYKEDDILLLGGHQPHVFRNMNHDALMHSVFFSRSAFGDTFLSLDEGEGIQSFYAFAKAGLKTRATSEIKALFKQISSARGIQKLVHFIALISVLRSSKGIALSQFLRDKRLSERDGKKMNAIFDYSLANFSKEISLSEVSDVATMTPNAFCKYFKKRTNKTYFQFLTEVRIEESCKLLLSNEDLTISEIAEKCGFRTLSHFNRKFRALKGRTPKEYRKQ